MTIHLILIIFVISLVLKIIIKNFQLVFAFLKLISNNSVSCVNNELNDIDKYNVEPDNQCSNILQLKQKKIEIKKKITITENLVNQFEYSLYELKDNNLIKIDLSECEGKIMKITRPIKEDYLNISKNNIKLISKKGYDIFNSTDKFYHDYCTEFSDENNANVPIKSRREDYFKELCEENCEYYNFNYENMTVSCRCLHKEINEENKEEIKFSPLKPNNNFNNKIKNYNFQTLKCSIFKNVGKNAGFWIIFMSFLTQIIFFIIFNINGKRQELIITNDENNSNENNNNDSQKKNEENNSNENNNDFQKKNEENNSNENNNNDSQKKNEENNSKENNNNDSQKKNKENHSNENNNNDSKKEND